MKNRVIVDFGHFAHSYYGSLNSKNEEKTLSKEEFANNVKNTIFEDCSQFDPEEIVIGVDSSADYWRKEIYPGYKLKREEARKKRAKAGKVDLEHKYTFINHASQHLKDQDILCVIEIESIESDDIIAIICIESDPNIQNIIIARDHDFLQLDKYDNVTIYNPVDKEYMSCEDPKIFLIEQLIQGCGSDSIPSIQPGWLGESRTRDLVKEGKEAISEAINKNDETREAYRRNKKLIDFTEIPGHIRKVIREEYQKLRRIMTEEELVGITGGGGPGLDPFNTTKIKIR